MGVGVKSVITQIPLFVDIRPYVVSSAFYDYVLLLWNTEIIHVIIGMDRRLEACSSV